MVFVVDFNILRSIILFKYLAEEPPVEKNKRTIAQGVAEMQVLGFLM